MANVVKRGKSFRIHVSCGFDGNGKRIYQSMTYNPPPELTPKQAEKEAQRQAVLFEEKCRTGQCLDSSTRFHEFSEIWIHNYAEKQLKATTLARYKELLVRINAAANLPKDRLARNAGIGGNTVRSVLSGHNLRKDNAEKLSAALAKDVAELFYPFPATHKRDAFDSKQDNYKDRVVSSGTFKLNNYEQHLSSRYSIGR